MTKFDTECLTTTDKMKDAISAYIMKVVGTETFLSGQCMSRKIKSGTNNHEIYDFEVVIDVRIPNNVQRNFYIVLSPSIVNWPS